VEFVCADPSVSMCEGALARQAPPSGARPQNAEDRPVLGGEDLTDDTRTGRSRCVSGFVPGLPSLAVSLEFPN
jgi:hypothetical protein